MLASLNNSPRTALRTVFCSILLAVVIGAAILHRTSPTQPLPSADTVVLLLAPGSSLSDWSDASQAPTLARLVAGFSHGIFPTRTDETPETLEDPLVSAAHMIATGDRMPPHLPPTLAQILRRSQVKVITLANEDSAARAVIGLSRPDPLTIDQPKWRREDPGFPGGLTTDPTKFASAVSAAAQTVAPLPSDRTSADEPATSSADGQRDKKLVVATFDDLYRADQYAALALPAATRAQRVVALGNLDRVIDALTSAQSPSRLAGSVSLIVVSPTPSGEALEQNERLGPILFWSPDAGAEPTKLLTSPSTRATPGLLAGTDLAATVAAAFGLPPTRQHIGEGRAARLIADDGRLPARIRAWDAQEGQQKLLIYIPWILGVVLAAAAWASRLGLRLGMTAAAGAAFYPAALSIASGLTLGGWPPVTVYLFAAIPCVGIAASAGFAGMRGKGPRMLLGVVGLISVFVLIVDVLAGGALLARTPLSYSPMEAARFYGIGNEAAGALVGASLLTVAVFFDDRAADGISFALFVAAICLTLALPQLGAKAGSLVGALAGFGSLFVFRRSSQVSGRPKLSRVLIVAGGIVALIAAYAVSEGLRGAESRTHVGEAMAAAHQHGVGALVAIAKRKLGMDLHLMVSSPWAALLAVEAVLCGVLWRTRVRRMPADERVSMIGLVAAGAALLVFNDAGVVGAATCLLFAVPLALLPRGGFRGRVKQIDTID